MTTIVGIKTSGGVFISADRRLTSASGGKLGTCDKLIHLDGKTCMGVAAPYSTVLALRACIDAYEFDSWSSEVDIYNNLATIHGMLVETYHMKPQEAHEGDPFDTSTFQMLLGSADRLWLILHMREVIEVDFFNAVGSGREYALGYLSAVSPDLITQDPVHFSTLAIKATSNFDAATGKDINTWIS